MSERLKNCSSLRGDDSPRWSVCVKGAVQHLENWCREGFFERCLWTEGWVTFRVCESECEVLSLMQSTPLDETCPLPLTLHQREQRGQLSLSFQGLKPATFHWSIMKSRDRKPPWCYSFYLITWQLHGGGGWGGAPVTRGGVWPKWKSGGSWSWRLASNDRGCNDTQMLNDCLPCDFVFSCPLSFRTMACNHVIYCCSCDVEQKRRTTLWAHSPAAAIPGYSYSWPLRSLSLPPVSVTFTLCC